MGKWVKKKLGEIGDIITGSTPTTSKLDYWNGDYNFYSPADFTDNIYCDKTERTVTIEGLNVGRCIPENSIMVACIASIGKIAINKTMGITNQQINSIIPFDEFNYLFLYYLLLHKSSAIKNGAAQTTIPIINKEDFSNLEVTIPSSLSEQRRIASILSSADKVIDSTQKLIAKYKQIKQGMMEDLLKPKEGWKKVKLGECLRQKPDYGINAPAVEYDNNLPTYLRITDITEDGYYSRNDIVSVSSLDALNYKLEDGDLVFARTGASVGKTYLYNQKDGILVFAGFLIRVRTDEQIVLSQFFKYQTQTPNYKNWIAANSMRTGQPGINGNEYGEFTFYIPYQNDIPDLPEQCRIASILSGIDKKIESEEKVLEKYKKIKKGLMERLLNCENINE